MSTKSKELIRVLICDDHAIVRQGLKQILAKAPDMEVCGETGSQKTAGKTNNENHGDRHMDRIQQPAEIGVFPKPFL